MQTHTPSALASGTAELLSVPAPVCEFSACLETVRTDAPSPIARGTDDELAALLVSRHQGLWGALEWRAHEFGKRSGSKVDVRIHVAAGVEPPPGTAGERWSVAVLRIFEEMLSNVARHAQAAHVRIHLYVDAPPAAALYLDVRDDGIGAVEERLEDACSGGLIGMRARAALLGGSIVIASRPGRGTQVSLATPFPCGAGAASLDPIAALASRPQAS